MLISYARASNGDQSLKLQIDALEEAGCERVFQDQVSGIVNYWDGWKNFELMSA